MSSSLSTQEGRTLCCWVKCKEREDLHVCRFWHRGHNHSDTPLLSLLAVSPDSSCRKKNQYYFLKSSVLRQSIRSNVKKQIRKVLINFSCFKRTHFMFKRNLLLLYMSHIAPSYFCFVPLLLIFCWKHTPLMSVQGCCGKLLQGNADCR